MRPISYFKNILNFGIFLAIFFFALSTSLVIAEPGDSDPFDNSEPGDFDPTDTSTPTDTSEPGDSDSTDTSTPLDTSEPGDSDPTDTSTPTDTSEPGDSDPFDTPDPVESEPGDSDPFNNNELGDNDPFVNPTPPTVTQLEVNPRVPSLGSPIRVIVTASTGSNPIAQIILRYETNDGKPPFARDDRLCPAQAPDTPSFQCSYVFSDCSSTGICEHQFSSSFEPWGIWAPSSRLVNFNFTAEAIDSQGIKSKIIHFSSFNIDDDDVFEISACTPTTSCSNLGCGTTDSCGISCPACPITPPPPPPPPACTPTTSCSVLGCGVSDSCGNFCGACPAGLNPPTVSINAPATVVLDSNLNVIVTAHDNDNNLDRIELTTPLSTLILSCTANPTNCIRSFTFKVTSVFAPVFNLIASVFDTTALTRSATASVTVLPIEDTDAGPEEGGDDAIDDKPSKKSSKVFISSLVPGDECIAPGQETFLFASLKNKGDKKLRNVKVTATISELGIKSTSSSFTLRKKSTASKMLFFDIPEDAEEDIYYIRTSITSNKGSNTRYRILEVNSAC